MVSIQERNKEIEKLERRKALDDFVNEQADDASVIRAYQDLGDLVREAAEEAFVTIRDRQMATRRVVRKLMYTYW